MAGCSSTAAVVWQWTEAEVRVECCSFTVVKRPPLAIFNGGFGWHRVQRELLFKIVSSFSNKSVWIVVTHFRTNKNFTSRSEQNGVLFLGKDPEFILVT